MYNQVITFKKGFMQFIKFSLSNQFWANEKLFNLYNTNVHCEKKRLIA